MNVIICTKDFEPVALVDLETAAVDVAMRRRFAFIGITDYRPSFAPDDSDQPIEFERVTFEFFELVLPGNRRLVLATTDSAKVINGLRLTCRTHIQNLAQVESALTGDLTSGFGGH